MRYRRARGGERASAIAGAARRFHLFVANTASDVGPNSMMHSAFWARSYARYAAASGARFATYYRTYGNKVLFISKMDRI